MKKFLIGILVIMVVFIILMYLSFNESTSDYSTGSIVGIDDIENTDFTQHDSVLIAASNQYEGKMLKQIMQGEHYRKVWTTPIEVPVVYLDTLKGGLRPVKEGGGHQTRSLKLMSDDDVLYTMRSINKYPDPLIPEFARTLGIENLIIDGISAQHPYASIVVAKLSTPLNLESTHPQVMFIPKQDALEKYNDKYGNALYMFEYESEGETNWTMYNDILRLVDTEDLQELKIEYGKNLTIDKDLLIRARLFDIVIGDWDRHAEQWGWALQKIDKSIKAIPIPADRDNAFFDIDGILPTLISNKFVEPELRPFSESVDYMPGLVKPFDAYFLHATEGKIYVEQAEYIQKVLTDKVINDAFKVWPKQIYDLNGDDLIRKIKARRDKLVQYAEAFRTSIEERGILQEPLKGSNDKDIKGNLIHCFECQD
ncbi:hypothetical protein SAMN03097699_2200 [Flavobacteriaceae bacterium MAR_2010_188]|nr:hypothetical protein SAMN03097699_2200 [Flavobacteriaceae bacterium MAR_2010_188]